MFNWWKRNKFNKSKRRHKTYAYKLFGLNLNYVNTCQPTKTEDKQREEGANSFKKICEICNRQMHCVLTKCTIVIWYSSFENCTFYLRFVDDLFAIKFARYFFHRLISLNCTIDYTNKTIVQSIHINLQSWYNVIRQ